MRALGGCTGCSSCPRPAAEMSAPHDTSPYYLQHTCSVHYSMVKSLVLTTLGDGSEGVFIKLVKHDLRF
jgi:hypothetical protein